MSDADEHPRSGWRARLSGGPVVPLFGVCLGVVALTAAVTMGGQGSSGTPKSGVVTTASASDPGPLPAANTCVLTVNGVTQPLSLADARTLTQIAAVGWQVKAPAEMAARVLDVAMTKPGQTLSVTNALDMFTQEDLTAPTAKSLAEVRALATPGALVCVFGPSTAPAESRGKSGFTPRTDLLRQGVSDAFGKVAISGWTLRRAENTAETGGRAINVTVPDTFSPETSMGWVLAHWLEARGADYKLEQIAYADQVWTPGTGWRSTDPGALTSVAKPGRLYASVIAGTPAKSAKATKSSKKGKKRS